MTDVLTIGGIQFDGFSTPSAMGAGGKQALVVHKLPGGARVIDTLGPDEHPIAWSGEFYGNSAFANALALDAMRAAGNIVPLMFAGQFRSVVIDDFTYKIHRLPVWVAYTISCTVYRNPSLGNVETSQATIDGLVGKDMNAATDAANGTDPFGTGFGGANSSSSDVGTSIGGTGGSGL